MEIADLMLATYLGAPLGAAILLAFAFAYATYDLLRCLASPNRHGSWRWFAYPLWAVFGILAVANTWVFLKVLSLHLSRSVLG